MNLILDEQVQMPEPSIMNRAVLFHMYMHAFKQEMLGCFDKFIVLTSTFCLQHDFCLFSL